MKAELRLIPRKFLADLELLIVIKTKSVFSYLRTFLPNQKNIFPVLTETIG